VYRRIWQVDDKRSNERRPLPTVAEREVMTESWRAKRELQVVLLHVFVASCLASNYTLTNRTQVLVPSQPPELGRLMTMTLHSGEGNLRTLHQ